MPSKTKSEQMSQRPQCGQYRVDMTGQQFGRLTAIAREGVDNNSNALWRCSCSCGKEKLVSRPSLKSGYTRSCGCLYTESRTLPRLNYTCHLAPGEAARRNLLRSYKRSAKNRRLCWELPADFFYTITQQPCCYCGALPERIRKISPNGSIVFNGIDRVDNSIGYTVENSVSCCHTCNHAKCEMSHKEFTDWIRRAAIHLDIPLKIVGG